MNIIQSLVQDINTIEKELSAEHTVFKEVQILNNFSAC